MIDLQIHWVGLDAPTYARRFHTAAAIENFEPVLRQIGHLVIAPAVRRNFMEGGRPKWAPLKQSTIAGKLRAGYPAKTLIATGALMESAADASGYIYGPQVLMARPEVDYWIHHQRGTNHVPQRVIMNFQRGEQRQVGGLFDKFIADWLAANGLRVRGTKTMVVGGAAGV